MARHAVVAAGEVVERRAGAAREPDVVRVDEETIRVVRIDREPLVVPVLRVVEAAAAQPWALRAVHERPGCPAVRRRPDAELATWGSTAVPRGVSGDRLHLGVDDVRIARCDRDVDPSELVARRRVDVLDAGARVHRRPGRVGAPGDGGAVHEPVRVRGDRREGRAPAGGHGGRVEAVGAVLAEVVLHRRCEPAHADRGDDPRRATHVDELEPGDVLPLSRETVRRARPGPVDAAVVGDEEALLRARGDLVTRVRVDAHLAD